MLARRSSGYLELLRSHILAHGVPLALYSDRHGIFRVNAKEAESGDGLTELGRVVGRLKIEQICATTPQAKGRVERANQTLQDRLGLGLRKQQPRQAPGRIVDEDQQGAARAAALEPVVMRPVDLDQLPEPRTPLADLEHTFSPPTPRLPQPQADLNLPHRLHRHRDPLVLAELLGSQRRTEVRIALPQRPLDPAHHAHRQPVVRWLAATT